MRASFRTFLTHAAAVLIALLLSVRAAAQTNSGEISGVLRDVQGGALPGARVVAQHADTGLKLESPTDEQGRYHFLSLPVGMYVLTVELDGFRRVVRSGVPVQLGQTLSLDLTLDVGGLVEEIRVTANVPLLRTGSAEISGVIENEQVVQIPLNGRNFLALAQLSDAVVIPPGGTRGEGLHQAGPLQNVGGQRQSRRELRARGWPTGRDDRPARCRLPADLDTHRELRSYFQREEPARDAVRCEAEFLIASSARHLPICTRQFASLIS